MANDPYWLTEQSLAFHEPTRHATFEVRFKGEAPERVWGFSGLTAAERPGTPSERYARPDRSQPVRTRFTDLHGGLWAGVAWDWPTRSPSAPPPLLYRKT